MKKSLLLLTGMTIFLTALSALVLNTFHKAATKVPEEKIFVTTMSITNVTSTTADVSFSVEKGPGVTIKGFGVIIGKGPNLSVSNGKCWGPGKNSNRTGPIYTANVTGLTPGTIYYALAYATSTKQTVYGKVKTFSTLAVK